MRPRVRQPTRRFRTIWAASTTSRGDTRRPPRRSRRATALDPRAYKAWDNLGLASEALGDVAQAQQHYLKAIALVHKDHPRYDVVYANFADLLIKLGNYQRAFDLAAEAAERNPGRAAQLLSRGEGARSARAERPQRALVRAGHRAERRLPRAALSALAGLPQARASRRRRAGAEVFPGGRGTRTEGAPVKHIPTSTSLVSASCRSGLTGAEEVRRLNLENKNS